MLCIPAIVALLFYTQSGDSSSVVSAVHLKREEVFSCKGFLLYAVAREPLAWVVHDVYVGPDRLKGTTIRGVFMQPNFPNAFSGPLYVEESKGAGLFWVDEGKTGNLIFSGPRAAWMPRWSTIDSHYLYPQLLRTAKVLRKMYGATDEGRLKTIDGILRGKERLEAVAALRQLIRYSKNGEIGDYLVELSKDGRLPMIVQIDVNEELERRRKDWAGSKAQAKMVERFVSEAWRETGPYGYGDWPLLRDLVGSDEARLVAWLGSLPDREKSDARARKLRWQIQAMANPTRSDRFKKELFTIIKSNIKDFAAQDRDEVFVYLVKATKSASKAADQAAAARLLGVLAPFDDRHELQLRALLSLTREKLVRRELQALLEE